MLKISTQNRKTFLLFFLFLIAFSSFFLWTKDTFTATQPPVIRVGIFLSQNSAELSAEGSFKIFNLKTDGLISEERNQIITLLPHPKGIEILDQGVYSGPISIIPLGNAKIILFINGQKYRYRGKIEIRKNSNSQKLDIINEIGIEEYLYGVLKKEISPNWPMEALKAQAVAARTFALFNLNKYLENGYDICSSTNSQAYGGVNHENPITTKAVDATRGLVMLYEGKPINAVYHSDSGGYTEDSENVWGSAIPYLRSVESKYEEIVSPPYHSWTFTLTQEELINKLKQKGYQIEAVKSIEPVEVSKTGRIIKLAIFSDNQEIINLKANEFRNIIGFELIRSTLFQIEASGREVKEVKNLSISKTKEKDQESIKDILAQKEEWTINELIELLQKRKEGQKEIKEPPIEEAILSEPVGIPSYFSFVGSGNGHGVGMSQWGAYGMAVQGYKFQDILKYYYQKVKIVQYY